MNNNKITASRQNFLWLLAQGRLTDAEIMLRNHAKLRKALLHIPGLRHTRFFKNRIRFYREYARANGMVNRLRGEDRETLRHQFARSNCCMSSLKKAARQALEKTERNMTKRHYAMLRKMRLRRRKVLGLF